ncbi:MAG: glycine betaine/L-proline ABC transporter ATP-binding protein [Bacteroidales bacterium]
MSENTKITVKDLNIIFGKHHKEAKRLIDQGVSKTEILKKTNCTVAVTEANFDIKQGEIFVVMGLSGSGKSTLIRALNRLLEPTSGEVILDGTDVLKANKDELREIRRKKYGMVFQHFGLLPHRTVASNAAFGLEIQGIPEDERVKKAYDILKIVGLEGYEEKMTGELSGGMQQRVGLARALANEPEVLLMDEAFSALDPLIRGNMQDELLNLQDSLKKTIVFITHDLDEALKLGDRIAILNDGKIVQIGTPEEILTKPADEYVRTFVENVNRGNIVTAQTIMFEKPTRIELKREGTEVTLRKMRNTGFSVLPVVDEDNKFIGFVFDDDVVQIRGDKSKSIRDIIYKYSASVNLDTPVSDIIAAYRDSSIPIAVVDENNKLKGIVRHSAVVSEVVGKDENEIKTDIKNALEI